MNCPYCNTKSKVTNSRKNTLNHQIWRRRECLSCGSIWTSRENIDLSSTHRVDIGRDIGLVEFSRDKLLISIYKALEHLEQPLFYAENLTNTVIAKLITLNQSKVEIDTLLHLVAETIEPIDAIGSKLYLTHHKAHLEQ